MSDQEDSAVSQVEKGRWSWSRSETVRRTSAVSKQFAGTFTYGGLTGALLFFALSFTPSLLPRDFLLQGVASGLTAASGYGVGTLLRWVALGLIGYKPSSKTRRRGWQILGVAAVILIPLSVIAGRWFQNEVRRLMGIETPAEWSPLVILIVAAVVFLLIVLIARGVRAIVLFITNYADRWLARPVAAGIGVTLTALLIIGSVSGLVFDQVVAVINTSSSITNGGTRNNAMPPQVMHRSGSADSLVSWESLGIMGRDFTGLGPRSEDISRFNGQPAIEPVRVYVGIDSAGSIEDRVELAMQELDRTGAWDRKIVGVFTATGSGWVDPTAVDPLEYMHDGDTAIVAIQYSFLPSWLSFLLDEKKARSAGSLLINAVSERLAAMPLETRPKLVVFGESLGSFGTESAFEDIDDMLATVDGALMMGPVFLNPIHSTLTNERDRRSPWWRPVYQEGRSVRFGTRPEDLSRPPSAWDSPRVVYLQNASDPVVYWGPELLWRPPEWLNDPKGPDVSDRMVWLPIVTFWHTTFDLAFANNIPVGHGHLYGGAAVNAWAVITPPEGWNDADTLRLRALVGEGDG